MAAAARKGWENYMLQLQLHPLRTKAITAGVLAGISDSVAQKLSGIQRIQLRRLLLKMLFGFAYGGPVGHFFHKLMDIIFKGKKDNKTVAKKVLLEQLTSSPCAHFLFLLYYGLIVEGRPWPQVRNKVRKEYPSLQLTAWMLCSMLLGNISESPCKNIDLDQVTSTFGTEERFYFGEYSSYLTSSIKRVTLKMFEGHEVYHSG